MTGPPRAGRCTHAICADVPEANLPGWPYCLQCHVDGSFLGILGVNHPSPANAVYWPYCWLLACSPATTNHPYWVDCRHVRPLVSPFGWNCAVYWWLLMALWWPQPILLPLSTSPVGCIVGSSTLVATPWRPSGAAPQCIGGCLSHGGGPAVTCLACISWLACVLQHGPLCLTAHS